MSRRSSSSSKLERYRKEPIATLPFGVQKLVGVGRALAMEPKLLLLDEPSTGMNREEKENLARFLLRIKHELGTTMLWIEHGRIVYDGSVERLLAHEDIREFYLGVGHRADRKRYTDVKQYRRRRRWF